MRATAVLKSITRPARLRLARALSGHDRDAAARAREQVARAEDAAATARSDAAAALAAKEQELAAVRAEVVREADARRRAESVAAQFDPPTWTAVADLATHLSPVGDWHTAAGLVNRLARQIIRPFHKSMTWGDRLLTLDKAMGVIREPVFQAALDTFRGKHPYDQYNGPDSISWRLNTLVWAGREAARLDGDFVECGVFRGDMAHAVAACVGFGALPKTFYLYDSFEGYSPRYSSAADFPYNPTFLDDANRFYREPGLYEAVCARFAGLPNVRVVRGFLPDALLPGAHEKVAFLHIDLNSPAAEVGVLDLLFDRVVPGGVVVLDDYGWIDFAPQKEAEDAFFAARGYRVLELPTGQGLVVKR